MKNKIKWLKKYLISFKNPFSVLLYRFGFKRKGILKTKSFGEIIIKNDELKIWLMDTYIHLQEMKKSKKYSEKNIKLILNFLESLNTNSDTLNFNGINFLNVIESILLLENLLENGNAPFITPLKNKKIVDIGGFIGDTALIFANEGAEVYAFEPVPPIYDIAIQNIDLNPNLKPKIHFYNYAVSDKRGSINIKYSREISSCASASIYGADGEEFQVKCITMEDIYNIVSKPDLLLMDCEGSEYDIVLNSDLSVFKEILIEYHENVIGISYNVLVNELEKQGFKIKDIYPAPVMYTEEISDIGIIHALKKD